MHDAPFLPHELGVRPSLPCCLLRRACRESAGGPLECLPLQNLTNKDRCVDQARCSWPGSFLVQRLLARPEPASSAANLVTGVLTAAVPVAHGRAYVRRGTISSTRGLKGTKHAKEQRPRL